jgi:hypothetical protein
MRSRVIFDSTVFNKKLGTITLSVIFTIMMVTAPTLMTMPSQQAYAITNTSTTDANVLANALIGGEGSGVDPSSITAKLSGHSNSAGASSGTFVNPTNTYGMSPGIIITSGSVEDYNDGPNTSTSSTTGWGVLETPEQKALLDPIFPARHFDVTQLDIEFDLLPGHDTVFFNVAFGTDEWPEFVGPTFIDGFGLYVNGENIAFLDGLPININHPKIKDIRGTELDGVLAGSTTNEVETVHTFSKVVGDGAKNNKVTFIIADSNDSGFDTTAWISQLGGVNPSTRVCYNEDFDSNQDTVGFTVEINSLGERTLVPVDRIQTHTISQPLPDGWSSPDDPELSNDHLTSVQGFSSYGFEGIFLRNTSSDGVPGDTQYSTIPLESTTFTLTDLPEHNIVDISFLLAIIDSWDSDNAESRSSPDLFNVKVDGVTVFTSTHNTQSGSNDYGDINPDAVLVRGEHIAFNEGWRDSAYDMSKESSLKGIPHNGEDLTIEWTASGAGWQGGNDESWAIDDIEICTDLIIEEKKNNGGDNQWDTRPTFGISHEDRQNQVVENGFRFNSNEYLLTDNHHTDFAEQSVEIGTTNSFSATVYADKKLKIQEFLFGIPNVGEAHLAELGVEVWYDRDGEIEDVIVVQKSDVIDAETVSVSHEKVKCLATDAEAKCDTTTVSMTFLEPLADKVMAIKAIPK